VPEEEQIPKADEVAFKPVGALWPNTKGTVSIATGSIEIQGRKVKLTVLPNKKKSGDPNANPKWPDWIIKAEVPYDMDLGYRKKAQEE
jgi:hypothetical protein